ncbi:MAG: hypothetical protein NC301_08500 [Bacteroides sp.]|nr:hypothetical protein [Bacteroides sp.]
MGFRKGIDSMIKVRLYVRTPKPASIADDDNGEAITEFHTTKENFPKQYRDWQTGRWQQGIAYRVSLRHAHSLTRLKRLYSPAE